jgi:hypothetical protein
LEYKTTKGLMAKAKRSRWAECIILQAGASRPTRSPHRFVQSHSLQSRGKATVVG